MKAHLLYRDRDFSMDAALCPQHEDLMADLELPTLFEAMSQGDPFLFEVAKRVVLTTLEDPAQITYRQDVLRDCLGHPEPIREMYAIAVDAIAGERRIWGFLRQSPSGILHRSVDALELFVGLLRKLRATADRHAEDFQSEGLVELFEMLRRELDDEYFRAIEDHLHRLQFRDGVLMSAVLGRGNKGTHYVLRSPGDRRTSWKERIGIGERTSYAFEIPPRDEAGARALAELTDHGVNLVANALAQSTDHILDFFKMLCTELGFYVSCLNLHERLAEVEEPVCMPGPRNWSPPTFSASGLYDACLSLHSHSAVVGNDVDADGRSLVMITGANSGGKSTFLRSVGLAQLMLQSGMFVAATSFEASVGRGLFTHFVREEDETMTSGRLDEELSRMSAIADQVSPQCIVLCNESFASTNEREGSQIARQVVQALVDASVKVFFVTHLFDLADGFYQQHLPSVLFLRAQRLPDGRRTYRLEVGEPLSTSYGEDLYRRFGDWERTPEVDVKPDVEAVP